MEKKTIKINIGLDDNLIPESIEWENSDAEGNPSIVKSIFISGWDEKQQSSMVFNVWTKEMRVDEMHHLYVQSLISLTDGFQRATGNKFIHEDMRNFLKQFESKIENK